MLTDDENIIDLQFAVQYNLKNVEDSLFSNRSAEDSVRGIAESAIREVVGKSKLDFALYEGREEVAVNTKKLMQDILDRYKTGINVVSVTMQNAQPPEQVQAAFEDAVKAKQDLERQKNEGQAYANDVIPKARGTASRLLQEAQGYKLRVENEAQGNVSRFNQIFAQYQKAPEVTRQRMYLDAQEQIMSNVSKVIVDQKNGNNLLYLPLDKLMAVAGANAPAAANSAPATDAPTVNVSPNTDGRSRDDVRAREREGR
jgi:membrane protease subunit HflK